MAAIIQSLYVLQHAASAALLSRNTAWLYLMVSIVSFAAIYALKADTYDLNIYIDSVSLPYFEPAFSGLILLFRQVFEDPRAVIFCVQVSLASLYAVFARKLAGDHGTFMQMVLIVAMISSVSFTLGVNNALRQGFGSVLVLFAAYCTVQSRYIWALVLVAIATLFHSSSVFFGVACLVVLTLVNTFYAKSFLSMRRVSSGIAVLMSTGAGLVAAGLLITIIEITPYFAYSDMILSVDTERTPFVIKIMPILLVFAVSEVLLGKISRNQPVFSSFRLLRWTFVGILIPLIFIPRMDELAARLLFFYFGLEMTIILLALANNRRLCAVFILLSYTAALNSINVLSG